MREREQCDLSTRATRHVELMAVIMKEASSMMTQRMFTKSV